MRTWSLILLLLFVLAGPVALAQQGEIEKRKPQSKKGKVGKLELDKVVFSGHGKAKEEEAKLSEVIQMPETDVPEEPQPLTKDEHSAAVEQIRVLASQQELRTRTILTYTPQILPSIITARTPRTSWGSIRMDDGSFDPDKNLFHTYRVNAQAGLFRINMRGLQPGVHYMLDITVGNDGKRWVIGGLFNGVVLPSAGHIIVGFVATSVTSNWHFYPYQQSSGYFYSAKLTRLN